MMMTPLQGIKMRNPFKGLFKRKPKNQKPTDEELKASIANKLDNLKLLPADEAMGLSVGELDFDDLDAKEQLALMGESVAEVAIEDLPIDDQLKIIESEVKALGDPDVRCITDSSKYQSKIA